MKEWTDRLHQKVISTAKQDQAGTDHGRSEGRQYGVKPEQKPIGGSLDRLAGECQQQKNKRIKAGAPGEIADKAASLETGFHLH